MTTLIEMHNLTRYELMEILSSIEKLNREAQDGDRK
jgi:hypothetical protein